MTPRNYLYAALAAGASLGLTAGAMAAEPFNGPFIGGQVGWQHDAGKVEIDAVEGRDIELKDNSDSFVGGVFAGYDAKINPRFVLGGEVGVDLGGKTMDVFDAKARRTIGVSARAGTLISEQTLLYVRGGYANARYRFADGPLSMRTNRDGWLAGAGVEHAIGENMSARLEYRYSDFGDLTDVARVFNARADDASLDRHQVLVGVAYRF